MRNERLQTRPLRVSAGMVWTQVSRCLGTEPADAAVQTVLRPVRFQPALDKGRAVEGTAVVVSGRLRV